MDAPRALIGMASEMPYPARVVGLPVMLPQAGVMVTAAPTLVRRPLASTVNGRTWVALP